MMNHRIVTCLLASFMFFVANGADGGMEARFPDGRIERGRALPAEGLLRGIESDTRRVWFTHSMATWAPAAITEDEVVYELRPPGDPGRPELPLVVDNLSMGQWTEDLTLPFTCDGMSKERVLEGQKEAQTSRGAEPEFKGVLEAKRVSGTTLYLDAQEYRWPKAYPAAPFMQLVLRQIPEPKDAAEKLQRARFLRQAALWDKAEAILDEAAELEGADAEALKTERLRLEADQSAATALDSRITEAFKPRPLVSADIPPALAAWWSGGAEASGVEGLLSSMTSHDASVIIPALRALPARGTLEPGKVHHQEWKTAAGESRHYEVYIPPGWTPGALHACLVVLHGQTAMARSYIECFIQDASRLGIVVISPEYIYDRKWGYFFSDSEHEAALGALRLGRLNHGVDPERVILVGHSQGGHMSFDLAQAHPGEFAGAAPFIGAPWLTVEQLRHHARLPLYIVDGEFDGSAPEMNRTAIRRLASLKCPAVYVEYRGRSHDLFLEEMPRLLTWAAGLRRQDWAPDVNALFGRRGEGDKGWLRLPDGTINNIDLRTKLKHLLVDIKGTWKNGRVTLTNESRLKKVTLLLFESAAPKGMLEVLSNGREVFKGPVEAYSASDLLREVARTGDRWTRLRKALEVSLEPPPKKSKK